VVNAVRELRRTRGEIERLMQALVRLKAYHQNKDPERADLAKKARAILASLPSLRLSSEEERTGLLAQEAMSSDWIPAFVRMEHQQNTRRLIVTASAYLQARRKAGQVDDDGLEFLSDTYGWAMELAAEMARLSAYDREPEDEDAESYRNGILRLILLGTNAAMRRVREAWADWDLDRSSTKKESALLDEMALASVFLQDLMGMGDLADRASDLFLELGKKWESLRKHWGQQVLGS
jgi:hypothetical protein